MALQLILKKRVILKILKRKLNSKNFFRLVNLKMIHSINYSTQWASALLNSSWNLKETI